MLSCTTGRPGRSAKITFRPFFTVTRCKAGNFKAGKLADALGDLCVDSIDAFAAGEERGTKVFRAAFGKRALPDRRPEVVCDKTCDAAGGLILVQLEFGDAPVELIVS